MPIYKKDGKAVLFVHIPKVGGTTIDHVFLSNGWIVAFQDGGGRPDTILRHLRCSLQHFHADLLQQVMRIDSFDAVFTVLRDPVDRLISEYHWRRQHAPQITGDFEPWVNQVLTTYRKAPFVLDNHIRPQSQFVLPGAQVTAIESGLGRIFDPLERHLSMRFRYEETRVRNASDRSTPVQMTPRLERRIRRFYAADIKLHRRILAAG